MITQYQDLDIYGRQNADGSPILLYDDDAIKNALTLWMTSKKGDFLYQPETGGTLDGAVFKNITTNYINRLEFIIKDDMNKFFTPTLIFQGISITPDYVNRINTIEIKFTNPISNVEDTLIIYTDAVQSVSSQLYEDVPYTGENLRMFCLIKEADMAGKLLVYNEDMSAWVWGKYKFINFDPSTDPFAEEIFLIINGSYEA